MSSKRGKFKGNSTKAVHAGEVGEGPEGTVTTPIYQTSTFYYPTNDPQTWDGMAPEGTYVYTRWSNPTIVAAEEKVAALENAEKGLLFSSGMAAISTTFLAFLSKGDNIVTIDDLYGGTFSLMKHELPRFGIEVRMVNTTDLGAFEKAIDSRTRLAYLESPTNPLLKLADIREMARIARAKGVRSMIDSTFATPVNQNPLEMGVDIVMHSCTKYLNGHSDLIAGAIAGKAEDVATITKMRTLMGGTMDPMGAFLLVRGMKTLDVRMARHNQNALAVAKFLESHPSVQRVFYPGLPSHPQHELAKRQMRGFGGMVSFEVKGGRKEAENLLRQVKVIKRATSLGGVDSLVSMPLNSSHSALSPQERERLGIRDSLVRLSVGIEDAEDLFDDLDAALRHQ